MDEATFSKPLIQFSVEGWSCVLSLLFDLRPNSDGGNEDFLQKVPCSTAPLSAPNSAEATTDPSLHQRFLDTQGKVWVSLLLGHCSFLLGPVVHKVLFVPLQHLFPQSCVSSGGSMVG